MSTDTNKNIEKLEADLWEAADNLRANSKLTSSDYFMPVLGVIFLRHAANRFEAATRQIEEDQASGKMPKRKVQAADYLRRRALWLPETARYDWIMQQAATSGADLPKLVTDAMTAIEAEFEPLQGVLPKDFGIFETKVLEDLMRHFNSEQIKQATGDVFGRIYEYFLAKFSMQKAHDNGEFFTPSSIVQTIVNVIEPNHGIVADLAVGSAGMFVQSSHFIEHEGGDTAKKVIFYGQEKNRDTIRLAKMNLAVHGLEGKIAEAITYYQDEHSLVGECDFVMANPPFNVDLVDAERIKTDPRLPFGLPGVNKQKKVGNGNYLWISYFWSYLNEKGRAGFVMSSQASSAGHGEKDVRRKIVETGDVDVMISIRSNFFYTRTVPCELWFFDRAKPPERRDKVLMLDARNIYRKVTRKIYDFSPEQMKNLSAIVWLYRGQQTRFLSLVRDYEVAEGMFRRSVPAYDEKVVRELLVNALVHRPYTQQGDIYLNLHPERLEVVNPGRLPLGVTPRNMLHASRRRNEGLARVFHDLGLMEREGSGFDLIYDRLLSQGRPAPVPEEGSDWVKVTIQRRIVKAGVMQLMKEADERFQLTQRERITLGTLAQTEGMTARELAAVLETDGSDTLAIWLGRLPELGLVQSAGRTQGTRYFVDPTLLRDSGVKLATSLKRIEPHRLVELVREDLRRYPRSKIGEISNRIGSEVNRSLLKRALLELVRSGVAVMEGQRNGARYRLTDES